MTKYFKGVKTLFDKVAAKFKQVLAKPSNLPPRSYRAPSIDVTKEQKPFKRYDKPLHIAIGTITPLPYVRAIAILFILGPVNFARVASTWVLHALLTLEVQDFEALMGYLLDHRHTIRNFLNFLMKTLSKGMNPYVRWHYRRRFNFMLRTFNFLAFQHVVLKSAISMKFENVPRKLAKAKLGNAIYQASEQGYRHAYPIFPTSTESDAKTHYARLLVRGLMLAATWGKGKRHFVMAEVKELFRLVKRSYDNHIAYAPILVDKDHYYAMFYHNPNDSWWSQFGLVFEENRKDLVYDSKWATYVVADYVIGWNDEDKLAPFPEFQEMFEYIASIDPKLMSFLGKPIEEQFDTPWRFYTFLKFVVRATKIAVKWVKENIFRLPEPVIGADAYKSILVGAGGREIYEAYVYDREEEEWKQEQRLKKLWREDVIVVPQL